MAGQNKKVVLSGYSELMFHVLDELLEKNYQVLVLTPEPAQMRISYSIDGYVFVPADLESVKSLAHTLRTEIGAVDVLALDGYYEETEANINLMKAAVEAGIKHVIVYGVPWPKRIPAICSLGTEGVWTREEKCLQEKGDHDRVFTYTVIQVGLLLEDIAEFVKYNASVTRKPVNIYNGGDIPFSVVTRRTVSGAVATALTKTHEWNNSYFNLQSSVVTQNQLMQYARAVRPGVILETEDVSEEELRLDAETRYNVYNERGERLTKDLIDLAVYCHGLGTFEEIHNDLFGIQQIGGEEIIDRMRSMIYAEVH